MSLNKLGSVSSLLSNTDKREESGKPLILQISLIDDDPNNREDISDEALAELAEDIKARGVKTPVAVRQHPTEEGRYILNYGHRRKAASIIAGKETIPAWIDNDFEDYDQLKENLLQETVSPRDIARFIQRKLEQGEKKGEIARKINKSAAFVSQHAALLSLPESIQSAFDDGRCADVTVINNLASMHKKNSAAVDSWLADEEQDITRNSVSTLKSFIDDKKKSSNGGSLSDDELIDDDSSSSEAGESTTEKPTDPTKIKKAIVLVEYQGREARLILNKRPSLKGVAHIKFEDDGAEIEVELSTLKILELIEG
ncbi:ParB/RepB/Spo0J family partition protein [Pseudoalteromonas sp. Of11M-6]|uniref:ParB/RepB/Spo0J family partition protein n=1 Tax=Pseudoalteromonas sp. Of11M-6 TaxID=2917754 RepID=UPI001EF4478A|nr:ParB/RepB/Spo0J family partition protein [Pseudoalteromonas sp. Of11M-6]MCG7556056.1 ParB/RepB/Spo0J family partition protein [Pseudoalteromonas sp. Of11M-6]